MIWMRFGMIFTSCEYFDFWRNAKKFMLNFQLNFVLLMTRNLLIATRPYNWACTFDHLAKLYFLHSPTLMLLSINFIWNICLLLFCRGTPRNKRSLSPSEWILCTSWTNRLQCLLCLRRWCSRGIYLLSWTLFWWIQGCM